jgi:hypothetical protein
VKLFMALALLALLDDGESCIHVATDGFF